MPVHQGRPKREEYYEMSVSMGDTPIVTILCPQFTSRMRWALCGLVVLALLAFVVTDRQAHAFENGTAPTPLAGDELLNSMDKNGDGAVTGKEFATFAASGATDQAAPTNLRADGSAAAPVPVPVPPPAPKSPEPAPAPEPQVAKLDLAAVKQAAEALIASLKSYYAAAGGVELLEDTMNMNPRFMPDEYEASLMHITDKVARALLWQDTYTIAVMGSSVAAGHDNCHYDSYEAQLERLMAPVWAAAGVDFAVHNAGQGGGCGAPNGDSFSNQPWCFAHTLGENFDEAHYSWTYFGEDMWYQELFTRFALQTRGAPATLILKADAPNFRHVMSGLGRTYAKLGFNGLEMQQGLKAHSKFKFKWGAIGDSIHKTTRYGEPGQPMANRAASLGVVYRNWHPGPLMFQLVADSVGYRLATAILRAVDALNAVEDAEERKKTWPQQRVPGMALGELPKPFRCDAEFCSLPHVPACLNLQLPTYGQASVEALLPPLPAGGDAPQWLRDLMATSSGSSAKWQLKHAGDSPLIPDPEKGLPECKHLDHCGAYDKAGGQQPGWIGFKLPVVKPGGWVALCFGFPKTDGWAAGKYKLDDQDMTPGQKAPIHGKKKCVSMQKPLGAAPTGGDVTHSFLAVWFPDGTPVGIDKVVAWDSTVEQR